MRETISGDQWRSVAISRNQNSSRKHPTSSSRTPFTPYAEGLRAAAEW